MKIGIDFSINSTGMAIQTKDKAIKLYNFVSDYEKGFRKFKVHEQFSNVISIRSYKKFQGTDEQKAKLLNADTLSDIIVGQIEQEGIPEEIRMEGFSFGSKGNAFIDLITFNTFLKVKLIQKFGHIIKVIPPKTLKKCYSGNGNASKCDMLRHFMKTSSSPVEEELQQLILSLDILREEKDFIIPKPIDDIVDAIALISFD
jgi:hypothetical protein